MIRSLAASLKPGGRLAIIDFPPREKSEVPSGVRANRGGHGVPPEVVQAEVGAALKHMRTIPAWVPSSQPASLDPCAIPEAVAKKGSLPSALRPTRAHGRAAVRSLAAAGSSTCRRGRRRSVRRTSRQFADRPRRGPVPDPSTQYSLHSYSLVEIALQLPVAGPRARRKNFNHEVRRTLQILRRQEPRPFVRQIQQIGNDDVEIGEKGIERRSEKLASRMAIELGLD